ncbi:SAM-dependent methyltransferase [Streptomyces sp. KLMMK]|uniref:SAM-dependent methyltransferase n=1 Tax=Streptomyces sp. KLMMK TaxID=3109353 RepID=UPI002FFDBB0C
MPAKSFEIHSIATVVGGHTTPADDYQGGIEAIIRLHPQYPLETLQGIEEFSHLTVVWHFHRATPDDVALHARSPRGDARWPATGTFVHRNHRRPNQLALSFPRLLRVKGRDLHVTDLDAIDGTPVVDLAPYFPQMGPRSTVTTPDWPAEMLHHYWDTPTQR